MGINVHSIKFSTFLSDSLEVHCSCDICGLDRTLGPQYSAHRNPEILQVPDTLLGRLHLGSVFDTVGSIPPPQSFRSFAPVRERVSIHPVNALSVTGAYSGVELYSSLSTVGVLFARGCQHVSNVASLLARPRRPHNVTKHGDSTIQEREPVSTFDGGSTVADHRTKPLPRPCGASHHFRSTPLILVNNQTLRCRMPSIENISSSYLSKMRRENCRRALTEHGRPSNDRMSLVCLLRTLTKYSGCVEAFLRHPRCAWSSK